MIFKKNYFFYYKGALRSNLTSSLNLNINSKHSSPFPRLSSGLVHSGSNSTGVNFQESKALVRPKTVSFIFFNFYFFKSHFYLPL